MVDARYNQIRAEVLAHDKQGKYKHKPEALIVNRDEAQYMFRIIELQSKTIENLKQQKKT